MYENNMMQILLVWVVIFEDRHGDEVMRSDISVQPGGCLFTDCIPRSLMLFEMLYLVGG
jgi:hypothetical protein